MRGIFGMAPRNFSRGKTKNYAWHGELSRVEKGFATPRNCHAWQSKPLPCVPNIRAMPLEVCRVDETQYTHCFEAYLDCIINDNSCFTGTYMANASFQLCLLLIGSQQL